MINDCLSHKLMYHPYVVTTHGVFRYAVKYIEPLTGRAVTAVNQTFFNEQSALDMAASLKMAYDAGRQEACVNECRKKGL